MAILKNDELETLQKVNNLLYLTTYECARFYDSLTEEQKKDIVHFSMLVGKFEDDKKKHTEKCSKVIKERRKINKEYAREKRA